MIISVQQPTSGVLRITRCLGSGITPSPQPQTVSNINTNPFACPQPRRVLWRAAAQTPEAPG